MKALDLNKDGKLSFEELKPTIIEIIKTLYNLEAQQEEQAIQEEDEMISEQQMMKDVFEQIDTDGSGFIEWNELENFMNTFSELMGKEKPGKKQIDQIFKIMDKNKDGKLSFDEMAQMLKEIVMIINDEFDDQYNQIQY